MKTRVREWERAHESWTGDVILDHVGGVPWHEARKPRKTHRCEAQTRGWTQYFNYVERCACGAIRFQQHGPWDEKNSRRRSDGATIARANAE